MLVLMRKEGEEVFLDKGTITVKVLKVEENKILLGFQAPNHIDVDRKEIFLRKHLQVPHFLNTANPNR